MATATSERGGRPNRVLVCDDERHIVRLLRTSLERQGHTVACAFNGEEAIELLESAELLDLPCFDKVVLDAIMPKADGYEVLSWIRTHHWARRTWVAMMVPAQDQQFWEGRPHRADMYVTKPFNPTSLFR